MSTCKKCALARKALCAKSDKGSNLLTKGLIACSYWSTYQESGMIQDEKGDDVFFENPSFDYAFIMEGPKTRTYFNGWADLKAFPEDKKGSGWHTNFCVLIHETDSCKHFRKRE